MFMLADGSSWSFAFVNTFVVKKGRDLFRVNSSVNGVDVISRSEAQNGAVTIVFETWQDESSSRHQ